MDQKTPRALRNIYIKQGCNFQRDKDGLKKNKAKTNKKQMSKPKKLTTMNFPGDGGMDITWNCTILKGF